MVWTGVAAFSSCFEALEVVLPAGPVVLGDRRRGERAVCQAEQRPRPIGWSEGRSGSSSRSRRCPSTSASSSPTSRRSSGARRHPTHWVGTTVRWDVEPSGAGATVNFRHAGFTDHEEAGRVAYTWGQIMVRLKAYAESGKPDPVFA
jgi:hypothetical protein